MSAKIFELNAESRSDIGKGASRRLRRKENKIPAIVYGSDEKPTPVILDHNKVLQATSHEAFYSHILTLNIANKKQKVVLKDMQRHPYKKKILHMDFQRVKDTDIITMRIPIHFIAADKCPGVKMGGIINHQAIDVEVRCQAIKLPEFIEVDLSSLELDHAIHLSDLKLPEGIEILTLSQSKDKDHDLPVVSVHLPRMAKVEEAEAAASATATTTTATEGDAKKPSTDKDNKS